MNAEKVKNMSMLFAAAFIWGIAFVAQSAGMEFVGPFTFNGIRFMLGGIVLIPCIFFLDRKIPERNRRRGEQKALFIGGTLCGCALCAASSLQQIGLQYTTVGKAGFITTLYIIMVPLFGIFLKKRMGLKVWLSVALAVMGFYFLCLSETLSLSKGDVYELLGAMIFSVHILLIDYFSPKVDGVKLSCIQFFVSAGLSFFIMFLREQPTFAAVYSAWLPIGYAGIFSCGIAYTLQVLGQKNTDPTAASLILSLESVFALLAGIVLLRQPISMREGIGCAFVFCAVLLIQIPSGRWHREREKHQEKINLTE